MQTITWLFTKFTNLYWWQMILWVLYLIYFGKRSLNFWDETTDKGIIKGYQRAIFGYDREFKVYHIVLIIFDIPPAILGLTSPLLKKILCHKIYEFKPDKTPTYEFLVTVMSELIRDSQIVETNNPNFYDIWNEGLGEDYEKLTWYDFNDHDVVLGNIYEKNGLAAREFFAKKYDIDVRYLKAYYVK